MARARLNAKLSAAVASQSEAEVVAALSKRADPNMVASDGFPAIVHAGWKGYGNIIKLLLNVENIDVDSRSRSGLTALILASQEGHTDAVGLLLDHRADINAEGVGGITALTQALKNKHDTLASSLISRGGVWTGSQEDPILPETLPRKVCSVCKLSQLVSAFSRAQLKKSASERRCSRCPVAPHLRATAEVGNKSAKKEKEEKEVIYYKNGVTLGRALPYHSTSVCRL